MNLERAAAAVAGARILILVENLPVPFDRRVWQEATTLRRHGCEVTVICPKGRGYDAEEEEIEGVRIFRHDLPLEAEGALGYLREYLAALWSQARLAARVRRRHGFDVIQACNPPDLLFLTALPYRLTGRARFIFDHHDLSPELFEVKFGRRGLLHAVLRAAERATFALADASIATNETFRDIAVARGRMDRDRVRIVRSYPNLARFRRVEPQAGLKRPDGFLVGYVGIIGAQDGVDLLVRAMADLVGPRGRDDVDCVIIGDGPALAGCQALAAELGVAERVRFAGYLGGEALLAHLSAVDVGVIPDPSNAFNDKLSMNKVFEYMALGLPFVQFNLRQAASEAGEAALVASGSRPEDLAAAIETLLDDPERRGRMSAYGAARAAREFTWESQEPALLEAYALALEAGGRRRRSA
ncbi:glycosyltransferase family 4 protein [Rubrimonas cliftonensis]|uniref:Glycosyltransferase involved in cell wall bisynthesis n=1 Tax=Rubrimonas cliftonensis TaxID=89524 RepID=A0A1H4CTN8_9RHOB|nr:glycosyltransferase family 4 protein [Rubrimonas cliftonensis]SEA63790.1 Glycosyltransferase involved in cell wall bisynthesis [Rubrimonas cliftonensis]